jgi:hypothetical protein
MFSCLTKLFIWVKNLIFGQVVKRKKRSHGDRRAYRQRLKVRLQFENKVVVSYYDNGNQVSEYVDKRFVKRYAPKETEEATQWA